MHYLSESPAVWYDEGFYMQTAANLASFGREGIQVAPGVLLPASTYVTVGYPVIAPVAAAYFFFGQSVLVGRTVMVLFLVGFLISAYVLIRRLFGVVPAFAATLLLATFPVLYGNGKAVLGEVPGLFFVVLTLLVLLSLERHTWQGVGRYAALGFFASLAIVTKPIYLLLLPAVFIGILIYGRGFFKHYLGIVVGSVTFLAPFVLWIVLQFGFTFSFKTVLSFYANPYFIEDLSRTIIENLLRFITEISPLYLFLLLSVWGVSLFLRRRKLSATECAAAIFTLLILAFYLRTPGWYRYFFQAQVMALMFFPAALSLIAKHVRTRLPRFLGLPSAAFLKLLCINVIALLPLFQAYQLAFHSYVATYYRATRTAELSTYFEVLPQDKTLFVYNAPETVVFFKTRAYYQYIAPHPEQLIGEEELSVLSAGTADVVITGDAAYRENPELFNAYVLAEIINRYVILTRK
ncbi:MAG: glycosyltransferase family 39 protein [Minisyncoccia bacterium]